MRSGQRIGCYDVTAKIGDERRADVADTAGSTPKRSNYRLDQQPIRRAPLGSDGVTFRRPVRCHLGGRPGRLTPTVGCYPTIKRPGVSGYLWVVALSAAGQPRLPWERNASQRDDRTLASGHQPAGLLSLLCRSRSHLVSHPMPLRAGTSIGHYDITALLAEGGIRILAVRPVR